MKTKNRLLLTSAMMLALIAVSGTTATYAWWTVGLDAKATVSTVSAAADASLKVDFAKGQHTKDPTVVNGTTTISIVDDGTLTDVTSADGLNFKKATLNPAGSPASLVGVDITKAYAANVYYAITYSATIYMSTDLTEDLKYNVYLGDGNDTSVLIVENGGNDAARMAVSTGTGDARKFFIVGNGEGYYQSDINTDTAAVENYKKLTGSIEEVTTATKADDFGTNFCLGTLSSTTKSLVITFTMWFEGAVTEKNVNSSTFSSNLYIYAVRVAA